ncbi:GFA family protein [Aurantivibrio infirmus]
MIYSGKCLCGNIKFEIASKDPLPYGHCHCTACRKSHGADFTSATIVRECDLSILEGNELLTSFQSSVRMERQFCTRCGSRLFVKFKRVGKDQEAEEIMYTVSINSLDRVENWRETGDIFLNDRAPWVERNENQ